MGQLVGGVYQCFARDLSFFGALYDEVNEDSLDLRIKAEHLDI